MTLLLRPGILVGCAVAATLLAGCGGQKTATTATATPPRQPVEVVAITKRDMTESLNLVGSLAANETAQIRAEISGQVLGVAFSEGELVKKGHVLLRLDDAELRAQLAQSEARFHLSELNLKRSENLTEARSMSQAEADRMRSEFSSAEAELQLLRVRLAKMEIKAPFDGVVGARSISPGDFITAATAVTTLDDLSRMKIDFQVPERFFAKVSTGTRFNVGARGIKGGRVPGEVYFVSASIDRATRSSQVKGYLNSIPAGLRPGMFANVELVLSVKKDALTVPEGAILTTPRGTQLVLVRGPANDPVAELVGVKLGLRARGLVEIEPLTGTFADGERVVASGVGALALFPGAKLEPRPQKEQFRLPAGN
ncbi:MAG: czcB 2 [Lacunisphaera sp.]|nr:czcB 2 [Lacunisphaera sp.]